MIGEQWAKLGTALVKLLGALALYFRGRKSARADQAEAENEAREKQAQVAADLGGLSDPERAERVRRDGF